MELVIGTKGGPAGRCVRGWRSSAPARRSRRSRSSCARAKPPTRQDRRAYRPAASAGAEGWRPGGLGLAGDLRIPGREVPRGQAVAGRPNLARPGPLGGGRDARRASRPCAASARWPWSRPHRSPKISEATQKNVRKIVERWNQLLDAFGRAVPAWATGRSPTPSTRRWRRASAPTGSSWRTTATPARRAPMPRACWRRRSSWSGSAPRWSRGLENSLFFLSSRPQRSGEPGPRGNRMRRPLGPG
jgi:hypothetical protein